MKKLISCVLAVALVFSLLGVSVFAGDLKAPYTADQGAGQYDVVGTHGDKEGNSYDDGVTDFDPTTANAEVGVSFEYQTTTETTPGNTTTTTHNILEHRYAIDIYYAELVLNLGQLTTQTVITEGDSTETINYSFVWDVNTHTYVMIDEDGNVVNDGNEETTTDTVEADSEVIIQDAFYIVNHSDLDVYYSASIAVTEKYDNYLDLNIRTENTDAEEVTSTKVDRSVATYNETNKTWTAGQAVSGAKHTIVATPDNDWLETIGVLVAENGATTVTIGQVTITVAKSEITT